MRKQTKKEERKKKATFQNPFLLFLSFVLFCLYYPPPFTKIKFKLLADVSVLFQHPLQSCNTIKIFKNCCVSYHPPWGRRSFSMERQQETATRPCVSLPFKHLKDPKGHSMKFKSFRRMTLRVLQLLKKEGCTGSCCSFLLAFHGEGSTSPWRLIGVATIFKYFYSVAALKRVPEEHRNVCE